MNKPRERILQTLDITNTPMLKHLQLDRPLAVVDVETTGTDTRSDRIIEVAVLRIYPGGGEDSHTWRINPGVPIPGRATAVHGITDADIAGAQRFEEVAPEILELIEGVDLCGFNLKGFDLRILAREFDRSGHRFPLEGRRIVDVFEIFRVREPRDLSAAVRFYCGRDHEGAHSASSDVRATAEVLDAQVARYQDLPRDLPGLHREFTHPEAVDLEGCFQRSNDQIIFSFGKHTGRPLGEVAVLDPGYLGWMLGQDFLHDTKEVVERALRRPADGTTLTVAARVDEEGQHGGRG